MRLSNIFLAVVLTVTVSVAHAIPNMWGSGFTMGVTEFSIDNGKWGINISCTSNPNENNVLAHTIYIYKGDKVVANSEEKILVSLLTVKNSGVWFLTVPV